MSLTMICAGMIFQRLSATLPAIFAAGEPGIDPCNMCDALARAVLKYPDEPPV